MKMKNWPSLHPKKSMLCSRSSSHCPCHSHTSHRNYCLSVALPSLGSLSLCHSACTGCCCSILLCREHERLVATTCGSLSLVQSFCLALCGQWIGLYRHHMRNMPTGLLSLFTCGEVFFESMGYLAYHMALTELAVLSLIWNGFSCTMWPCSDFYFDAFRDRPAEPVQLWLWSFFESMGYLAYRLGFGGTGNPLTDLEWVSLHYVALLWLLLWCLSLCCMWCDFCCCSVLLICVYGGTGKSFHLWSGMDFLYFVWPCPEISGCLLLWYM